MSDQVCMSVGAPALGLAVRERHPHSEAGHHGSAASPGAGATSATGRKPNGRPPAKAAVTANAEKVLRAFNTWAFKREQPSDPQLMLQVIANAMTQQTPVPFVLYWGKGPRSEAGAPEVECLDYLAALASRVKAAYPLGTAIKLILTDTHAELNGHAREAIAKYFEDVTRLAAQRGIETCWLGQLVKAAGQFATAAPLEDIVPTETLSKLTASAAKWYRGPGTSEDGALTYLRMNLIEQRVVERAFPQAIFVTFNGSELRCLFPKQLPIFYMYSLRRGFGVKPWFLAAYTTLPEANRGQDTFG
jgi:hypothetical protein